MHLALRVNAFGFAGNTNINASYAQNLFVNFFMVSRDQTYSSSLSDIDFSTSNSRTKKKLNKQALQNGDKSIHKHKGRPSWNEALTFANAS